MYVESGLKQMFSRGTSATAKVEWLVIQTSEKIKFGKSLAPEQRYYLLNVLKKFY